MKGKRPVATVATASAVMSAQATASAPAVDLTITTQRVWGDALPPAMRELEQSLVTAFHAFDLIDAMTMRHRVRVVDEVTGAVVEAAFTATRAGHARWACMVVRAAADRPPSWSSLCTRWDSMIADSLLAVNSTATAEYSSTAAAEYSSTAAAE